MSERIAASLLLVVVATQLLSLWPLPPELAKQRLAFYSNLKAQWEATDPARSQTPGWTQRARTENLAEIDSVLSNPDDVLYQVIFEWSFWLVCAVATLTAALAAFRKWRPWPWLSLAALALFMWVQQPWQIFRLFVVSGQIDLAAGIEQLTFIRDRAPLVLVANILVPVIFLTVGVYAVLLLNRRRSAL
jgi:hypothetical protein